MIKPTIGRVVWYHPNHKHTQPWAAIICFVHSENIVNLVVFDENSYGKSRLEVPLIQEENTPPSDRSYCTWMPYQIGQAKKEEK